MVGLELGQYPKDDSPQIKVGAYVSRSLHKTFNELFPQQGAMTWVVRTAMELMVELAQRDDSMRVKLQKALSERMAQIPDEAAQRMMDSRIPLPQELSDEQDDDYDFEDDDADDYD